MDQEPGSKQEIHLQSKYLFVYVTKDWLVVRLSKLTSGHFVQGKCITDCTAVRFEINLFEL